MARQCALLGVPRSRVYARAVGERLAPLQLRRLLEEQETRTPGEGVRRLTAWLKTQGDAVHAKRVARRLRVMGVAARDPQPYTRRPTPGHRIYPYLLRGRSMRGVQHVWSTAITSIRRRSGCMSLVAVLAWCSRSVVAWAVSLTRHGGFCVEAWARALEAAPPELFHRDPGAQFTSGDFTSRVEDVGLPPTGETPDSVGTALYLHFSLKLS